MSVEKKIKKDKEIFLEVEMQIKDLKHQLNDQLRCLDHRLENQVCIAWELQEFFQQRAEIELEYSRNLERLVKQIMARHKAEKQKGYQSQVHSAYKMWQTLLDITLRQGKCHDILSEAYSTAISAKFTQLMEDMQRIYRKCREMAVTIHDEMTKVVTELHSSMKAYYVYHNESQQDEQKLEKLEKERSRGDQKVVPSRRLKNFEKQYEKLKMKYDESDLKAVKARNDYLLCLDSTNGSIHKFLVDDLPELMNVMDYGYHVSLGQIMVYVVEMEETVYRMQSDSLVLLSQSAKDLNQRSDRQTFLQQFHTTFSLPRKFEFQAHRGDLISEVSLTPLVRDEMIERLKTITEREHSLRSENETIWETLETLDTVQLERRSLRDMDIVSLFQHDKEQTTQQSQVQQQLKTVIDADKHSKSERLEVEKSYLNKFKEHQLNSNLMARLRAKRLTIEAALGSTSSSPIEQSSSMPKSRRPLSLAFRQTKSRCLGQSSLASRPKLFGGCIEEYVRATGQEIPPIVRSCIRIINLHGMHHQGVFRIPGSQYEISDLKDLFERGDELLPNCVDGRDINSIAGILKLYFRELREPLFPVQIFDELIACPSKYNVSDTCSLKKCLDRIQELLLPLPHSVLVVMRYLFAFLNHISEYSDENMMDAYNLAVCFGPTLMPIQSDQIRSQSHVNELIRILIVHQETIFPRDGGPVYEKCIVVDDTDDSSDGLLEDNVGNNGDEDIDCLEAVALHDFVGQSTRELSFHRGDVLFVTTRVSPDWWEGTINNQAGLIPHKYITINGRCDKDGVNLEERLRISTLSAKSCPLTSSGQFGGSASQLNNVNIHGRQPRSGSSLGSFPSAGSSRLKSNCGSSSESLQSLSNRDTRDVETESCGKGAFSDRLNRQLLTSVSDIVSRSSILDMEPTPNLVLNLPFNISRDTPRKATDTPSSDAVD